MVTILISAAFKVAALIRGIRFFQCEYPKKRRLLEAGAYLRPDAYHDRSDRPIMQHLLCAYVF